MKMAMSAPAKPAAKQYTCPMHPEIVRDAPGKCPKCGMTLVPKVAAAAVVQVAKPEHAGMADMKAMTGMTGAERSGDMMVDSHKALLWPHYLNLMLGFWLVASPFTLGYLSVFNPNASALRVMAERGLSSFETRNMWMTYNDIGIGFLVIVFSYLAANTARRFPWAQWALALEIGRAHV